MSDMCQNWLKVCGKTKQVRQFRKQVDERNAKPEARYPYQMKASRFSFHRLIPMPKDILDQGYDPFGYDWQKANWGVKWGACNVKLKKDNGALIYYFETAWYPPVDFIKKVSGLFPKLQFTLEWPDAFLGGYDRRVFVNAMEIEED